ncbi:MAG: serine hydrolase, partial [Candidatus Heimdallarchaeota archaeon]|nr:serine hydrolase [Candidatus Heimdallarchaeota archaeon]
MSKKSSLKFGLIIGLIIFGMIILKTEGRTTVNSDMEVLSYAKPTSAAYGLQARPDTTELINFVDLIIPDQLSRYNIPGMTISVVMDEEIVLSKGFGRSDYLPPKYVHNQTLFRIGSVSKT